MGAVIGLVILSGAVALAFWAMRPVTPTRLCAYAVGVICSIGVWALLAWLGSLLLPLVADGYSRLAAGAWVAVLLGGPALTIPVMAGPVAEALLRRFAPAHASRRDQTTTSYVARKGREPLRASRDTHVDQASSPD